MFFEMVINKYISTELTCVNAYGTSGSAGPMKGFASGHRSASDDVLFPFFLPKTSACAFPNANQSKWQHIQSGTKIRK